jgi:Secretion system C-terminal sorting domain
MITDGNGCSATSEDMLVTYTGINELNENSISLYPNPVGDKSIVRVQNSLIGKYFYIYTISGELVLMGKLNVPSNLVSCEELAPGVYVLRVDNERIMLVKS